MEIRKCRTEDVEYAGAFYDKVVAHMNATGTNYPKWMYKDYPSYGSAKAMTEEGSQFLCTQDGAIIGAFVINDDPQGNYQKGHWSRSLDDGEYMVIHALAVDPEYQGKGIATQIVDFCIAKAKTRGYKAIRLDVVPGNFPAARLYEKAGFSYVETLDLERNIPTIPLFSLYELYF